MRCLSSPTPTPQNKGGFIIWVAIADVAAYLPHATPLDAEALFRGNSCYFPDRVVPMLPERLSNDLCSLRAGEDRPVLVVAMTIDSSGEKTKHQFYRAMNSQCRRPVLSAGSKRRMMGPADTRDHAVY